MIELMFIVLTPVIGAFMLGLMYLVNIKLFAIKKSYFNAISLSTPFVSFLLTLRVFFEILHTKKPVFYIAYKWIKIDNFDINMGFFADNLSIFMALFITFVGWLIHIYATSYMEDDECYGKFFFYFNLFLASMLLLILANSPIIMFIGWEGVGVCSYFLISYYYKDNENVVAGNKAFLTNRVGDAGFVTGMCVLFFYAGKSGFDYESLALSVGQIPYNIKLFIGTCFFVGAMAKSAQIPLYVWLPDAMAGPTPVSALIHAATMVTAGIYMVSRFAFLYNDIISVGLFIAYIGAFSSLFAAIIATKQRDIKKILAYSTMSQLGYMFVAVGLANYSAGLFHVFTHAFFKALLFMGAGAVIVALHHEQDIFKMGGLKKKLPVIYSVMLIGCLAISGIPPFSGFFSKDEILFTAFAKGEYLIWGLEVLTAFLTSYYMFRLFFVVFYGEQKSKSHKVSLVMSVPLMILAFGASVVGFLGIPEALGGHSLVHEWLGEQNIALPHVSHFKELGLMGLNVLVGTSGISLAWIRFKNLSYEKEEQKGIIYNKFYIDEIYDFIFVQGLRKLSLIISKNIDLGMIDASILKACKGFIDVGEKVAILQNANIRGYVFAMLIGLSFISFYLLSLVG